MTKIFFLAFCLLLTASPAVTQESNRISFNAGWLFQKDDPVGAEGKLSYPNIKDWVRPSGNPFVDESKQVARPRGNIGEDVTYAQAGFNDSQWRKLDLPHDWGIEGDFVQEVPGESGKRPWAGIAWYRKHF